MILLLILYILTFQIIKIIKYYVFKINLLLLHILIQLCCELNQPQEQQQFYNLVVSCFQLKLGCFYQVLFILPESHYYLFTNQRYFFSFRLTSQSNSLDLISFINYLFVLNFPHGDNVSIIRFFIVVQLTTYSYLTLLIQRIFQF
ncbi:hypothetical protein pb186bvf_016806 [Paramecium bursaria]